MKGQRCPRSGNNVGKLMKGEPTKNEAKRGKKVSGQKGLGYAKEIAGGMKDISKSDQKTKANVKRAPEGDGGGR